MKTKLIPITITLISICALNANATGIPVIDVSAIAQSAYQEVVNFLKYAKQETDEAATELHTLDMYEHQLLQIARYGDPGALRNLPAIRNIAELEQVYGQFQNDISDIQSLTNPNNAKTTFNQILSEYQQPNWQGWKTSNGTPIGPGISNFQFPTSNYNIAQTVGQQLQTLTEKKKTLQSQRDSALLSLQNATDSSAVAKYHALIAGLNGAIADLNEQLKQISEQGNLQRQKTQAAQEISKTAQEQHTTADAMQSLETDVLGMPTDRIHTVVNFDGNQN
jgi:hypothetical protein